MLMPYAHWIKMVPSRSIAHRSHALKNCYLNEFLSHMCSLSFCLLPHLFLFHRLPAAWFARSQNKRHNAATKLQKRSVDVLPLKFDFTACLRTHLFSVCVCMCFDICMKNSSIIPVPAVCFRHFTLSKLFLLHFHFHNFFFVFCSFLFFRVSFVRSFVHSFRFSRSQEDCNIFRSIGRSACACSYVLSMVLLSLLVFTSILHSCYGLCNTWLYCIH